VRNFRNKATLRGDSKGDATWKRKRVLRFASGRTKDRSLFLALEGEISFCLGLGKMRERGGGTWDYLGLILLLKRGKGNASEAEGASLIFGMRRGSFTGAVRKSGGNCHRKTGVVCRKGGGEG